MKILCVFIAALLGTFESTAQKLPSQDSVRILSLINDWNQAWDVKDHVLASKWYSQNARFTNAFGDKRDGQKEVEMLLKEVFALPFVMSGKSETNEHTFQVLNNNTALVHTAVTRKGQKMPDNTIIPDRQTTHMRVFQKEKDGWRIKAHLISDARDKQSSKH